MTVNMNKNILLVEDDAITALVEQQQLRAYGYSVVHVSSGRDALEKILAPESSFDLILMDIDLGSEIDGTLVAEEILKHKDIPVVFLTSHTEPEVVEKTEKITSFGYVVKNTGIVVLDASIKMAFRLYEEKLSVQNSRKELLLINEKLNSANEDLEVYNEELASTNEELILMNNQLMIAEKEILKRENLLSNKLDTIFNPGADVNEVKLEDIIDIHAVQSILDNFCALTGMVTALLDLKGNVLVSTGWQNICTNFHRVNKKTAGGCTGSDLHLSENLKPDEFIDYKCKNGLWDVITPLYIGSKHVGNVFTGQFFYEDDIIDEEYFSNQADIYGFEKEAYLKALHEVPVYKKETIRNLMFFLVGLFKLVSRIGFSNILLAKESAEHIKSRDELFRNEKLLRQQLSEKEIILREVHHRIKNNLSVIGNLLKLQADSVTSDESKNILHEAIGRVENMYYIYEKLLLGDNYKEISVKDYLEDLVKAITGHFSGNKNVELRQQIDDFNLDVKKLFLIGTIVNELITNSMKYAFNSRNSGSLQLSLLKCMNEITLTVRDDGVGFTDNNNLKKNRGFGLMLIKMLTEQLNGTLTIESDNGTSSVIKFEI